MLLLFPLNFTARIPGDMRSELIHTWQLVLIFYFGSEGTVQAIKVPRPGVEAGGDVCGCHDWLPGMARTAGRL